MDKNVENNSLKKQTDESQCLFEEINKILDDEKYKVKKENIIEVKKSVEKIQNDTNDKKTNIVLVGDFNSGKTTCFNTLIATFMLEDNSKSWSTYNNFSPSSKTENTYYILVAERSKSDNFELYHYKDENLIKTISSTPDQVKDIKKYLIDLDIKSTEELSKIKDIEVKLREERENPNFSQKNPKDIKTVPMNIVKIMIPGFSEDFRIIDIPGLTSVTLCKGFFNYLDKNCLVNIFLVVRSLVHPKVTDADFVIASNNIVKKYPNSLTLLLLTKVDEIIEEEIEYELVKFQDILKMFLGEFCEKSKLLNYFGTYLVSCKEALKNNEVYKNGMNNLKNCIIDIEQKFSKKQKMTYLLVKLNYCFNEFNNLISEKINCFTTYEISQLKKASVISCDEFEKSIKTWINIKIKDIKYFKEEYKIKIEKLKELFDKVDKIKLTDKYYMRRNSYIEDQMENLGGYFQTNFIESEIKYITETSFQLFIKELPVLLSEKVNKFLLDKGLINKTNNSIGLSLESFLIAAAGVALSTGIRFVIVNLFREVFKITVGAAVPVLGWLVIIGGSIISFNNYIALWSREGCFDDIVKLYYNNLIQNKESLLKSYINGYKEIFEKIIGILRSSKEDTKMNVDLKLILDKKAQSEVNIEDLKDDGKFKNSLLKCMETFQIPDQNNLSKVKDFLNEVVNKLI